MKKLIAIAVISISFSESFAATAQQAYCACSYARAQLFVGMTQGRSARSYGVDTNLSLMVWSKAIEEWTSSLITRNYNKVKVTDCELGGGDESSVKECRSFMKQYPDAKF
ncbi:hypothetical protein [Bdellovibrio bacteriovorus]|uniref:hypothetical protein n=1 Tax=Bdellovibrio bacteriovorus TaxID=959 RepID=UPI0035A65BF1